MGVKMLHVAFFVKQDMFFFFHRKNLYIFTCV
jgi:hypothetical protein